MAHQMYPNYPAATDRYSHAALLESSRYPTAAAAPVGRVAPTTVAGPPWPAVSGFGVAPAADPAAITGVKRPAEVLYHQSIMGTNSAMGTNNAIGQSEDLFSTNSFAKHPRLATASILHNYPQRLGEKDCAHYMLTRTCKFGANCKFNHPAWVPDGGMPGWKEASLSDVFPERPGEPDCPYTAQRCRFGSRCKFNHPKITIDASASGIVGELKDLQKPSAGEVFGSMEQHGFVAKHNELAGRDSKPAFPPALLHNSSRLPNRLGGTACAFYLKTGSCKYGAACRYDHPNINSVNSQVPAGLGQAVIPSQANHLPLGVLYAANLVPIVDPFLAQSSIASRQTIYPQRPGEHNCDHYMKFGQCKSGERCKFHHPIERSVPRSCEQNVKLTIAGLPERQGAEACPFYMKFGACKFGVRCKFDHPLGPLPGDATAIAPVQGNTAGIASLESATPAVGEDGGTAVASQ